MPEAPHSRLYGILLLALPALLPRVTAVLADVLDVGGAARHDAIVATGALGAAAALILIAVKLLIADLGGDAA